MKISKKSIAGFFAALALVAVTAVSPLVAQSAFAACDGASGGITGGVECAGSGVEGSDSTLFGGSDAIFTTIINTLLFIIGALSVVMLIYGGIRYTISSGDAARVTAAKNTIMYAIVGLIVAFLAFAIVNWVLGALVGA